MSPDPASLTGGSGKSTTPETTQNRCYQRDSDAAAPTDDGAGNGFYVAENVEVVTAIADALRAANRYPARLPGSKHPNEWEQTVDQITRRDAAAVVPAVVGVLRDLARRWESSDLMDAAAWVEGTL